MRPSAKPESSLSLYLACGESKRGKIDESLLMCAGGSGCSVLVDAGLGVGELVQTGHFKSRSISSLAFVHVVAKGQDDLQELPQGPALDHLLGCKTQS